VCQFYSISPLDLDTIEISEIYTLIECIDIIEAQEMLRSMKVADFPNMKPEHRGKIHRDLYKRAYPVKIKESRKSLNIEDIAKVLNEV